MTKKIVVGVDSSDTALQAAHKAASLAHALGAELYVVSTFNVRMLETIQSVRGKNETEAMSQAYHSVIAQYSEAAERTAVAVTEALRTGFPDLTITPKAAEGEPGVALSAEAERLSADMIVVGNKRVQGLTRILGSVARSVASEAQCDLYIIHTHQR